MSSISLIVLTPSWPKVMRTNMEYMAPFEYADGLLLVGRLIEALNHYFQSLLAFHKVRSYSSSVNNLRDKVTTKSTPFL